MSDLISRQAAIDAILAIKDYGNSDRANALGLAECAVTTLPSVQPEQIARDIATIIENEQDMRVILNAPSAQPEIIHCGDCKYKDDGIDEDGIPFLKCLNGRSYGGTRINDYCSWAERGQEADSSGNMSGTHKNSNSTETHDLVDRQAAIDALRNRWLKTKNYEGIGEDIAEECEIYLRTVPSAQPDISEYSDRLWKLAYERGKRDAQANIVQCEDCKWRRNRNGTMAWIPCRALVTPDDFYCKYAERKEQ